MQSKRKERLATRWPNVDNIAPTATCLHQLGKRCGNQTKITHKRVSRNNRLDWSLAPTTTENRHFRRVGRVGTRRGHRGQDDRGCTRVNRRRIAVSIVVSIAVSISTATQPRISTRTGGTQKRVETGAGTGTGTDTGTGTGRRTQRRRINHVSLDPRKIHIRGLSVISFSQRRVSTTIR